MKKIQINVVYRDPFWDSAKFILIFLVLYGHMIMPKYQMDNALNMAIFNFIYMFHMPLFVFISGRFSKIRDKSQYNKSILRILETYIVLQIVYSAMKIWQTGVFRYDMFWKPQEHLWYLLALVWWRLIIKFTPPSILNKRKRILVLSLCVTIFSGFVPIGDEMAIQRTFAFFLFFMLGYYSNDFNVDLYIYRIPKWVAIVLIAMILGFFIAVPVFEHALTWIHHCNVPYWNDNFLVRLVGRIFLIPASLVLSCMFIRLIPANTYLAYCGKKTMFIYGYHFLFVLFCYHLIQQGYIPSNEFLLLVYSVILIVILLVFSHVELLNTLLNPITNLNNKKLKKYEK